jgi:nucleoside-diphosphate-sugar epimerase
MDILVTGGSGFIGTRLVEDLLKDGHNVKIYDKSNSEKYPELVVIGDVRDVGSLIEASKGVDIIYNLAAEHADDVTPVSLYADVNIGGAKNVVLAANRNNIKHIVFTSSVAIYGLNRGEPDESFEAEPFNEYGRTKYEAEKIFAGWAEEDKTNSLTIVRPSVIFGENNRGNVYNLIKQIESGKFLMVGSGKNKKSMGYVGNIAAFLASVVNAGAGIEVYNFAGKPDLTSKEIIHIIKNALGLQGRTLTLPYWLGLLGGYTLDILAKITGKKFPISSIRIKKFTAETTVNTDKLLKSGFKEPFTLEEGLNRMIRHELSD